MKGINTMVKPFQTPNPLDWVQDKQQTSKTRIEALEKRLKKLEDEVYDLRHGTNNGWING